MIPLYNQTNRGSLCSLLKCPNIIRSPLQTTQHAKLNILNAKIKTKTSEIQTELVGGFNPSEKYQSIGSFPQVGVKI